MIAAARLSSRPQQKAGPAGPAPVIPAGAMNAFTIVINIILAALTAAVIYFAWQTVRESRKATSALHSVTGELKQLLGVTQATVTAAEATAAATRDTARATQDTTAATRETAAGLAQTAGGAGDGRHDQAHTRPG